MPGWFTSGRRTTRSIDRAMATMNAAAPARARSTGTPASIRLTTDKPAKTTMMPWAKLKTPDALKMTTKPSAISEYITPALKP